MLKKLVVLCVISALSPFGFAQIYKCADANNNLIFTDKPCEFSGGAAPVPAAQSVPAEAPPVRPNAENETRYLTNSIKLELRGLLEKKRYRDLNVQLALYQASATANPKNENQLFTAYAAFDYPTADYRKLLDSWVDATPGVYQPYLARAYYSYGLAWVARGGDWSSETSSSQFDSMAKYFADAQEDIETALSHNAPSLVPSYLELGMWKTSGPGDETLPKVMKRAQNKDIAELAEILERALRESPASYQIRAQFMRSLYPRWGGSYEAMTQFSKLSQEQALKNPRIAWLEGFVEADVAYNAMISSAYKKADAIYGKVALYGDNPEVLKNWGKNSYKQEKYEDAVVYFGRSIDAYSEDSEVYNLRCKAYRRLKEFDNALADNERALLLNPFDQQIQKQRTYLAMDFNNLGIQHRDSSDYVTAIKHFGTAIEIDASKATTYFSRAWAFYKIGKYHQSLEDTKRSIELNPSYYRPYVLLDRILAKSRDWTQIIRYWNSYIAINPNNPDAYFERSGTYHHKGDEAAAFRDIKKASDLGHVKAREVYTAMVSRSNI